MSEQNAVVLVLARVAAAVVERRAETDRRRAKMAPVVEHRKRRLNVS